MMIVRNIDAMYWPINKKAQFGSRHLLTNWTSTQTLLPSKTNWNCSTHLQGNVSKYQPPHQRVWAQTRRVQIATKTHCNVIRELCHTRTPCHRQVPSWMCWSHLRGRPGPIRGGRLIVTSMITNGITMPHYENMSRPHSSMGSRCWVSSPDSAT